MHLHLWIHVKLIPFSLDFSGELVRSLKRNFALIVFWISPKDASFQKSLNQPPVDPKAPDWEAPFSKYLSLLQRFVSYWFSLENTVPIVRPSQMAVLLSYIPLIIWCKEHEHNDLVEQRRNIAIWGVAL